MTPQNVLKFWFEETKPQQWFSKDDAFDAKLRERFLDTYWKVVKGEMAGWRATPEGRLAEIIVLDQFARNMFRGTPGAFANDPLAFTLAEEAVKAGADKKLTAAQRHFLYMPYMHSESSDAHRTALRLFASLPFSRWGVLLFEWKHKRIIDRFGRFPHRNTILGRVSTPEELEFMRTNKGF
jgi:uncharacterized protein (DUF924 family)